MKNRVEAKGILAFIFWGTAVFISPVEPAEVTFYEVKVVEEEGEFKFDE